MVELAFLLVGCSLVGIGILGVRNGIDLVNPASSREWALDQERKLRRGARTCIGVGVLFAVFSAVVLLS